MRSEIVPVFSAFLLRKLRNSCHDDVNENRTTLIVSFNCHRVDQINLASIFGDKRLHRLLPEAVQCSYPPKIYYKMCNPISLKLCNYSKYVSSLRMDEVRTVLSEF